ncbi:MAG: AAA family ATPase [Tissierellia bacterium]|nr:AAA family ATPase [Tissierellia bacterium]
MKNYITQIELKNFQSHEDTCLEFKAGMNGILGRSDSGKTAILRAIRWCLYNEPSGMDFIREGQKKAEVAISFQNKTKIVRTRSKTINRYTIYYPDGTDLVLESFGSQTPEEVYEATGIRPIKLDENFSSSLNYQAQLEGPFLLNERDSLKASAIGRLVGVHHIDNAMRNTLRDRKKETQNKQVYLERRDQLEEALEAFSDLEEKEARLLSLGSLIEKIEKQEKKRETLKNLLAKSQALESEKRTLEEGLKKLAYTGRLEGYLQEIKIQALESQQLESIQRKLLGLRQERKRAEDLLGQTDFIKDLAPLSQALSKKIPYINQVLPLQKSLEEKREEKAHLIALSQDLEGLDHIDLAQLREKISRLRDLFFLKTQKEDVRQRLKRGQAFIKQFDRMEEGEKIRNQLAQKKGQLGLLLQVQEKKDRLAKALAASQRELEENQRQSQTYYDQLMEGLSEHKRCPLCLQEIDNETLRHVKDHYK